MSKTPEQRFAAIVAPHFTSLYKVALRLTRRRHDAEDLLQEVCLRAYSRLAELEKAAQPRAWLLQVQYRLFVDAARRRRRTPFAPLTETDAASISDAPGPDESADGEFGEVRLAAAWQRLDQEQRALLGLHAEGHTLSELAAICGISKNAASARLHRARARLAKLLRNAVERGGTGQQLETSR
jgi:RNA polymerase sigma-70 factor (ECF subfamily)